MDSLISVATVDITPQEPCPLGANDHPDQPWQRVAEPLEANLLVIHGPAGPVALATFDLLYVGAVITERIRNRLEGLLAPQQIWLSASHTHRAPAADPAKPILGIPDEAYLLGTADAVGEKLVELINGSNPVPVTAVMGTGRARHSVNRRRPGRLRLERAGFRRGGIMMGPNYDGPTDETVRRLDWVDVAGQTRASMWNYACHPTAAPDRLAITPDYPGVVRSRLRGSRDFPVLFFQGFCGDTRPPSVASLPDQPMERLLIGPGFRRFTPTEHRRWAESLAETVVRVEMQELPPGTAAVSASRTTVPSEDFVVGSPVSAAVFQSLRIGPVALVGVSAEPVADYVAALPSPPELSSVWPVGYLEDVFGYVPTSRQLAEGGYEAGGFCSSFNCESVNTDVERHMLRGLRGCLDSAITM